MTRPCTVCIHTDRSEIDAALVAGTPYRELALRFALSVHALSRHRDRHIPPALSAASAAADVTRADDLLGQVTALRDRALALLDRAEGQDDVRAAVVALREARGCVELLAKVAGQLNEAPTINLVASPDWVRLRTVLLSALAPFPDARAAAAAALLAAE